MKNQKMKIKVEETLLCQEDQNLESVCGFLTTKVRGIRQTTIKKATRILVSLSSCLAECGVEQRKL